ncbi:MAG: ATP-dependent DNA helicase RecQ [Lysobacteraceae bacterium]|nr:MAG: ATP-dependent DNA helicase RecQ [Xanthomonadaceae bacterium]
MSSPSRPAAKLPGTPQEVLEHVFGYRSFRGQQEAIIRALLDGRDALVLMPTGGGKSLCYQIPALLRAGTGIVISPLIALMQDQVEALRQLGVRAAFLNSTLSTVEAAEIERALLDGALDLLYVAPERLLTARFLDLLQRARIALFAIDEAHCVSQWGHDFRPEYRRLDVLHQRWPEVPRIALTATADTRTREEIVERLGLEDAQRFVSSFDRPNLFYRVEAKHDGTRQLLGFLQRHRGASGIVYCLSRKGVEDTARRLREAGIEALPYHAGLDAAQRSGHQRRFLREDGIVMVATIAFGMGIDKPDVRFVAHLNLPRSIEGYYQETGRAGRDGEPAEVWLCHGLQDVVLLSQMIQQGEAGEERKRVERSRLEALLGFAESTRCRRELLLGAFGEPFAGPCGRCDNCVEPPATWDATEAARQALSCVYRSGQRFGVTHLIDILRGHASERVRQHGHERLSTFGIGKAMDAARWRTLFRQLLAAGMLEVDPEGHRGLRLAAAARSLLRGEARFEARLEAHGSQRARGVKHRPDTGMAAASDPEVQARFERLREARARLARAQNVPAYVIFHDATLRAIAKSRPASLQQLAGISGVGDAKLERYGAAMLEALAGK